MAVVAVWISCFKPTLLWLCDW